MKSISKTNYPKFRGLVFLLVCGALLLTSAPTWAQVSPVPSADFSADPTEACVPLKVFFHDLSTGEISSWLWDFGNGRTSTEQNPRHYYVDPGIYTVSLTVTGPFGSDSETKQAYIIVKDRPAAAFTATPTSGGAPLRVSFTDGSTDALSWNWDFGDGTTSTAQNPNHTYTSEGVYIVTLIAENDCGSDTTTGVIAVRDPELPPVADFTAHPTSGCYPFKVFFTDLSAGNITSRYWDFGDGFTSTAQNPTHVFRGAGIYTVSLTVTGPTGSDTETKQSYITVRDVPISDFTATPTSGEAPLTVSFTDYSTDADEVVWRFGDGDSSTVLNPTHTYSAVGIYTVYHVAVNDCGRDSTSIEIEVTEPSKPPEADFGYEPSPFCDSAIYYFYDQSTGNITGWSWDFGDGTTATNRNPQHTYYNEGTYTVTLIVTGPGGTDTARHDITVAFLPDPVSDFNAVPTSGYAPLTVTFTDNSTDAVEVLWRFGDGDSSTVLNLDHNFMSAGIYTVWHVAINECGRDSTSKTIEVRDPNEPPHAEFEYEPELLCDSNVYRFYDRSTGHITGWNWDFGDGTTSVEQNPQHTYYNRGIYVVRLIVTGPGGADTVSHSIYVDFLPYPESDFDASPRAGYAPLTVSFTDYSDYTNEIIWRFGDGDSSSAVNPTHTYANVGIYTVYHIAVNDCGRDSGFVTITVRDPNEPPEADFEYKQTPYCDSSVVTFTDLSTGNITDWYWDFGDATSSTDQNPTHTYHHTGFNTVTLIVTGPGGADTTSQDIFIMFRPQPESDFDASPRFGYAPLTVTFTDNSDYADDVLWRFDDGDSSTALNPNHTYSNAGFYVVYHIAINDCGRDSTTTTIEVLEPVDPPVADFEYEPDPFCDSVIYYFSDLSTGEIDDWSWDFGDGATSTDRYPQHTYYSEGTFTVTLIVEGPGGADTAEHDITVHFLPSPVSDFNASPLTGNAPLTVTFTDNATAADGVLWRFGDGDSSTVFNPIHTYNIVGTYTVYHIAFNQCGRDSTSKTIEVTSPGTPPIADFIYDWDPFCDSAVAYFNDASIGNITSWSWSFGDGGTSNMQHPWHTYYNPGTYTVRLIVSGPDGSDTATRDITVWFQPEPTSSFTANPLTGDVPLTVQFTDYSSNATQLIWRFGDGTSTTGYDPAPSHTYQTAGTYTAYQIAVNACGRDSTFVKIRAGQDIYADFSGNSPVCVDSLVQFTDLSYGEIDTWEWNFGDGSTSTDQYPGHTYDAPGIYTVSLTVTGPAGTDTETKNDYITVNGGPSAAFDADPTYGLSPLTVNFTNQSVDADSVFWDFDDGSTSRLDSPSHTFSDTGHYNVVMTAYNDCGRDEADRMITVDIPTGELTIFKQVSDAVAEGDDVLTYYVAVRNTGDETERNVVVRDTVPVLTTFIGGTITVDEGDCTYDPASNSLTWLVDSIEIGDEYHLEFDVWIDGDAPDAAVILNRARITGPEPYGYAEATTVIQAPDIDLTKTANPSVADLGDTITYTVRAVNNGSGAVYDTRLMDDLPDEFIYIAGSARLNDTSVIVNGTDPLYFTVGDIAIGDSAVITYRVEISLAADTGATYINSAVLYENGGTPRSAPVRISTAAGRSWGPVHAAVALTTPPLAITKTASQPSGMTGDLIRYTIEVVNTTDVAAYNAYILDTLPAGFVYIAGTSLINGAVVPEPFGANPYEWTLGVLDPGEKAVLTYSAQISTRAAPDINDNIAWAYADQFRPSRATARVNVLSGTYPGSIRGILVVDCDGDGIPEIDSVPSGIDIYLDDGSWSRVNKSGMFYFSTVRAGAHVVKIDTRDLVGFYLPEDQPDAVFCHVHEMGESYIKFRLCPEQPILSIRKQAAILPKARVTKSAVIDTALITDSTGVTIDYEIKVETNGNADPSLIRVIDSLPGETRLILDEQQQLMPSEDGNRLQYEVTVGQQIFEQKVTYSLEDLVPGTRRFLNNKIHLEGGLTADTIVQEPPVSTPADVAVGPFLLSPPQTLALDIVGAYFTTALADLRPEAIPVLEELADSIRKYDGAEVKLEGHCDYRRIHTKKFPSNWELSFARAKSVADWLVMEGGIDSTILSYEGFAATRPVDSGNTAEALQRNRRVEVFITGKKGPVVDFNAITVNEWTGATVLELSPTNWEDSLVSGSGGVIDAGLNDSWEILLKVENTGHLTAERAVLTDLIPSGAAYIEGSAVIDGVSAPGTAGTDNSLTLEFGPLVPGQSLEIRYRIRAVSETMPNGGGAATVKVTAPEADREHISNEVIFQ